MRNDRPMRNDKEAIFGWAMYDWANSAYTTTTLAVLLPAIFTGTIMPEGGVNLFGRMVDGESMFAYLVSAAAIIAFLVSPVMGAVGDFSATKIRFLRVFAYTGAILSLGFALVGPGDVWPTVILFLVVETCWAIAAVFYDSLLPHLTTDETIDKVSSRGYAFGYLGGGIQFLLSLLLIQFSPDSFAATAARIGIVMAGLWWLGFAMFSFRRLREPSDTAGAPAGLLQIMGVLRPGRIQAHLDHDQATARLSPNCCSSWSLSFSTTTGSRP